MSYGAQAKRVAALGGRTLTDVDIYKLLVLCKTERCIVDSSGLPFVQNEIYNMSDYTIKCGGFNRNYYGSYVVQSFFDELDSDVSCEVSVMTFLASNATQASYIMLDQASSPIKIFDIYAGMLNKVDKSAYGNKIAIKVSEVNDIVFSLTAELLDSATTATLNNVGNLSVGNYIKFTEGSATEVRKITDINTTTKTITFDAITESSGFSISGTTVTRVDLNIKVAVKDDTGEYQQKESWEGPFAQSNTIGIAKMINDSESGSNYIYLDANASNSSAPEDQIPATLTEWTALTGGSDGDSPTDSDWNTVANTYLASTEFTFLLAPESASTVHNQNMVTFCTDGYKGMYYCQTADAAGKTALQNAGGTLRGSIKFGMIPCDKWINVNDPTIKDSTREIPMVGIAAGHWFNTYNAFGEAKVAAGNKNEMVLNATGPLVDNGLVHDDAEGVGGRLITDYSVNICKYTKGKGITINSARTLSTDDGYKYQNQIMMWILYSRSIVSYLKTIEQDKSGVNAQESHYNEVYAYMFNKFRNGQLYQGKKEDGTLTEFRDSCIIINDFTINTLADIAAGKETIFMQFVAPPPIETPILELASASVTTVRS